MAKTRRRAALSGWIMAICLGFVFTGGVALAQPDEVEGPWGTANGDIYGTAASDQIPFTFQKDGAQKAVEEAWRLDVRAEGHDRVAAFNPITFDKDGNLYWKTSVAVGPGPCPHLLGKPGWHASLGGKRWRRQPPRGRNERQQLRLDRRRGGPRGRLRHGRLRGGHRSRRVVQEGGRVAALANHAGAVGGS